MQNTTCYDQYPVHIVIASNLVSLSIYGIGAYILYQLHYSFLVLYILFIGFLELRLLSRHCVDCYYYGKVCAFGKGRLCGVLFHQGQIERFNQKVITWKDMTPDFLLFIIPILVGILLLTINFSWTILSLIAILFILGFFGNVIIRGNMACRYCKQRVMGCPAEAFFN